MNIEFRLHEAQKQLRAADERIKKLEAAIRAQVEANPRGSYPCLHYALANDDE